MSKIKKYLSLILVWFIIFNSINFNGLFGINNISTTYAATNATTFNYTGSYQTYVAPASGYYSLETWGASGGGNNPGYESEGGLGGYAYGTKYLNKGDNLYVFVGGKGNISSGLNNGGGYNGGGQGGANGFGGGGMTHISTTINQATANLTQQSNISGTQEFNFTGGIQTWTVPADGYYTLETYGAQGGGWGLHENEKGGYASGQKYLTKGTLLYICVGGKGKDLSFYSDGTGYNGGGQGGHSTETGGGATHIATSNGLLKNLSSNRSSVLIVAGGAGSNGYWGGGGLGGGLTGGNSYGMNGTVFATGATQTNGGNSGYPGSFGQGGPGYDAGGAGGGGWYGGAGSNFEAGGGGGSSYIDGLTNANTLTGIRSGNGYAKISYNITTYVSNGSWNPSGTLIVAGGGGGADNTNYTGSVKGGADDGSGGSGGGTSGGNASIDGVVQHRGNYNASSVNGGGCGSGGTQSTGFKQGVGESVSFATDTGGAGAGWYGGYVTNHNNGGAGGGSGYIGGVSNGRMSNGVQFGNGKAVITLLNTPPSISKVEASNALITNNNINLNLKVNLVDADNDKLSLYYSLDNVSWNNLASNVTINASGNYFSINLDFNSCINGKNIYIKANDGIAESNIYTYKYVTTSKTLPSKMVVLDNKYNGAIYYGENNQQTINYGKAQNDPYISIDTNITDLKTVKYYSDETLLSSENNIVVNPSVLVKYIHPMLPNITSDQNITLKIEITNNNNYTEILTTNIDNNGKILNLRKNNKPNIINFILPSNSYTQKNIYDKLKTNQNEDSRPNFQWNIDSGTNDNLYGDYIKNVQLKYLKDGDLDWTSLTTNELKDYNNYYWLNSTGFDNTKVSFKLIITDSLGDITEQILDNNYFLQINNNPNMPLNLNIKNFTDNKLFKNNPYTFNWGISTDLDVTDEITQYVFGFRTGTMEDGKDDYNNYTILYSGTNREYTLTTEDWNKYGELYNNDTQNLTFGVWAIDSFGEKSLIKTLNISSLNNQPPNKILKDDISIENKTYSSIEKGFIKKNETYTLKWKDKGDPNISDKIYKWSIYYSFDNNLWFMLNTVTINELDFYINADTNSDKIYFKIIPYDNYNLYTESDIIDTKFVSDINAPVWTNQNNYLSSDSDDKGQQINITANDDSGIKSLEIKDSNLTSYYLENYSNQKSIDFNGLLNKNGNYYLILTDIYDNKSNYILTINSVDVIAPTVNMTSTNVLPTNKPIKINYTILDDIKIDSFKISISNLDGSLIYIDEFNHVNLKKVEHSIDTDRNCIVTIQAFDKANNTTVQQLKINNINTFSPKIITDYNESSYYDMKSDFYISLDDETKSNQKEYKKIYKDDYNNQFYKIVNDENNKYIIFGTEQEISNISLTTLNNNDSNIEYWKVVSDSKNYNVTYDNISSKLNFNVSQNCNITVYYHDIWNNITQSQLNIKNILDGQVDTNIKYLVAYQDYHDVNPQQGDIDGIYINSIDFSNELSLKNYINPNLFVEISKGDSIKYQTVYGYIEINENYRSFTQINNYSNNSYIEILNNLNGNPYSALCKLTSNNKSTTFYIMDVLSHYITKKISIDNIQQQEEAKILIYPENTNMTNNDVNVLFTVSDGYFKNNDLFYQYQNEDNSVIKSYYDDFIWYVPKDINNEYPTNPNYKNLISDNDSYYKLYDGNIDDLEDFDKIAFVYKFSNNNPFKVWAINENGDWIYKYFVLTNIDKVKPTITLIDYDNTINIPDKLIINAKTNDYFYTKEELKNIYNGIYDDAFFESFDYELSIDKKNLKLTFNKPLYNVSDFKLYAKDDACNISISQNIDLTKIYKTNINFIYYYKFADEENYKEINISDLMKIKTNQNIDIKIKIDSSSYIFKSGYVLNPKSTNDNVEILAGLENILKYTLNQDNTIICSIQDSYGNIINKNFEFNNLINKNIPQINIDKKEILDDENNYITAIKLKINSNNKIKLNIKNKETLFDIYNNDSYNDVYDIDILNNGKYVISFEDEYGNKNYQYLDITNILNEDTKVIIKQTISNKNYTNNDVLVTFEVNNGYISEFTEENENLKIESKTNSKITYSVKENINNLSIKACNYINQNNITDSSVNIYNIDKNAPSSPKIQNTLTDDGYNSFVIYDMGDVGIGTNKFKYNYKLNNYDENIGELDLNKNTLNLDVTKFYDKGILTLKVNSVDLAGNISSPSNATIYSNDNEINYLNTTYKNILEDLKLNVLTKEKIEMYNMIIQEFETEVNDNTTYKNIDQKNYAIQKINNLKTLIENLNMTDETIIAEIKKYFNRLDNDIYDNEFMPELQILINKVSDEVLKKSYQDTYNYYKNLIDKIFIDKTNNEFNYIDNNGYILNPLSGYIMDSDGIYGYYNDKSEFIKGQNHQLYYYNSQGTLIQLSTTTYIDGNNNQVNIQTGLVNDKNYYDENGALINYKKYIKGFYDFNKIWHGRDSKIPVLNPEYIKDDDNDDKMLPTNIKLSNTILDLKVGDEVSITVTFIPSNTTEKELNWQSDNSGIVSIDNGKIKALKEGTTTITVETINNLKQTINVTVTLNNDNPTKTDPDVIIKDKPKDTYDSIDDLLSEIEEEKEDKIEVPSYDKESVGNIDMAFSSNNNLSLSEYKGLYSEGFSTVVIDTDDSVEPNTSFGSNMNVGVGNEDYMAVVSYKDITKDMDIKSFKAKVSNNKISLKLNSDTTMNRLGLNSYIFIASSDKDLVMLYNNNVIKSNYDETLKGYKIYNPLDGTYELSKKETNYIPSTNENTLIYSDVIKICYKILNGDDYNDLYSNISQTSDIYREASTLQKYGIIGKDIGIYNNVITGKDAFDILYLTLSNVKSESLNYNNNNYVNLTQITQNDLNNMLNTILNK